MQRISYVLRIDPKGYDEYVKRHEAVYPDLLQAFKDVGIHTYSIFFHEGLLFAYLEVEDYDAAMQALSQHPADQRWQEFMSDMLIPWEDGKMTKDIPEVFHFHKEQKI